MRHILVTLETSQPAKGDKSDKLEQPKNMPLISEPETSPHDKGDILDKPRHLIKIRALKRTYLKLMI